MIAGPNGAGKTTMIRKFIAHTPPFYEFLNADEIAKGLAPLHPETVSLAASKLLIRRLIELLDNRQSFAFETTASGINYVKHLERAKSNGYEVFLMFLWLKSPQQAVSRVLERVRQGGHSIPPETIYRRYFAGMSNLLSLYLPLASKALIVNNSDDVPHPIILRKKSNKTVEIEDEKIWKNIQELAKT